MVGIITLRYIIQITRIPITIRETLIRGNKLDPSCHESRTNFSLINLMCSNTKVSAFLCKDGEKKTEGEFKEHMHSQEQAVF